MKKILFLGVAQNFGGVGIATIEMAKNLARIHNVTIIDFYGSCEPFVKAATDSEINFIILKPSSNPFYIRSSKRILKKYVNLFLFIPHLWEMNRKLNKEIKRLQIDSICVSGFRPMLCMLLKKPNAEVIFFAHGWYTSKLLSFKDKFLLKNVASKIVCISEATKQALYNNGVATLDKMSVVHNYIDETTLTKEIAIIPNSKNSFKIMHCGGFIKSKGQHISIQIANELKKRNINFKLILAGIIYQGVDSLDYYEGLISKVKEFNLEDNVIFIVNKSNVHDYIRTCDVLIHPSETEGLPLSIMEAQIMRKPVISNAVGGVIDLIVNNFTGFLPNHNNVEEYVSILLSLQNSPKLYNTIANNAYSLLTTTFNSDEQLNSLRKIF